MIEQILDILLVLLSVPLVAVILYIYNETRYHSMLILLGLTVTIITAHLLNVAAITGPIIQGAFFFPQSLLFLAMPLILVAYLIKDKLWTLTALVTTLSFIALMLIFTLQIPSHGAFSIPFAVILWAWYKESPRCFNPMKCKMMQLKGKYIDEG